MSPLTLWLTDRSRYTKGLAHCKRDRYLTNHFGPTGYGIVRKAESLPLATGKYTHLALETLFVHLQQTDTFPTVAEIRAAIASANAEYERKVSARGFRGMLQSESTDQVIVEQQALITGLVWAACHTVLPWLHRTYQILQAEVESIYVLDCTCGLGSEVLDAAQHDAKGCHGIGQMLKQDVIAQHRTEGTLAYIETKTSGSSLENWASQWETRPQLSIGSFGIKEQYGRDLTETFILGLYKGYRKKIGEGIDATMRQESPFCYGYLKPGNPPLATDDWLPAYEWKDEHGMTKRASRAHEKAGVWTLAESDWPTWVEAKQADPTLTPSECWVASLPAAVLAKQVFLVGPMRPQMVQRESLKASIVGEELHWQTVLWELFEAQRDHGWTWASPEFQGLLDKLVPPSWDCQRFGSRFGCEYIDLCFRVAGWEDPLSMGKYIARRPHHQPELDQAVSRGLLPEVAEEDESEEE